MPEAVAAIMPLPCGACERSWKPHDIRIRYVAIFYLCLLSACATVPKHIESSLDLYYQALSAPSGYSCNPSGSREGTAIIHGITPAPEPKLEALRKQLIRLKGEDEVQRVEQRFAEDVSGVYWIIGRQCSARDYRFRASYRRLLRRLENSLVTGRD
jgi:hypothetical protein